MDSTRPTAMANVNMLDPDDSLIAPIHEKVIASFGGDAARMVKVPERTRAMMGRMSVEATLTQMGQMVSKQFLRKLNHALNQVKKSV